MSLKFKKKKKKNDKLVVLGKNKSNSTEILHYKTFVDSNISHQELQRIPKKKENLKISSKFLLCDLKNQDLSKSKKLYNYYVA